MNIRENLTINNKFSKVLDLEKYKLKNTYGD